MCFIVNGADWHFDGMPASQVAAKIECVLAFVATSESRGEAVYVGDDFQARPMFGELSLGNFDQMLSLENWPKNWLLG